METVIVEANLFLHAVIMRLMLKKIKESHFYSSTRLQPVSANQMNYKVQVKLLKSAVIF